MLPIQRAYWIIIGWSSPYCTRTAVAWRSASCSETPLLIRLTLRLLAKSPGGSWIMMNDTRLIPISTGIAERSRTIMNLSIAVSQWPQPPRSYLNQSGARSPLPLQRRGARAEGRFLRLREHRDHIRLGLGHRTLVGHRDPHLFGDEVIIIPLVVERRAGDRHILDRLRHAKRVAPDHHAE